MTPTHVRSAAATAPQTALDALARMADDLAGRFELQPLLERILRNSMDLLGCDSGSICTVDEAAGTYRKEVDVGVECLSGRTFPLDEGVTGEVVRAGGPVVFAEYSAVRGGHISADDRAGLHGVIGVPIRWNASIIGSCVVFSRDPDRSFDAADTHLLELFATHAAIAITNARLHALAEQRASETAIMAERERVLREMHDTVGRGLAGVLLHLDAAGAGVGVASVGAASETAAHAGGTPAGSDAPTGATGAVPNRTAPAPAPAPAAPAPAPPNRAASTPLEAARRDAEAVLTEMRRAVLGLGPSPLDGRSLHEAISLELAWARSAATVDARLTVVGEPGPPDAEISRGAFRIVQESLTNVVEHAHAEHVRVGLVYGDDRLAVLVEDDGRGFDVGELGTAAASRRLGLQGLVARAEHLGGTVRIDSTPGWGTRVSAELPRRAPALAQGPSSRWRVLVAHELPVVRAGLVRMLARVEPDIQVVAELGEADQVVDAYRMLRPHVVLAHLGMPGIDGARLTSYLRAADPQAAVVLMIETVTDERVRDAARNGAIGFVQADSEPTELARALVAAARGETLMTSGIFSRITSPAPGDGLTVREREVRMLVERGLPDKQIAGALHISVKTVEKHVGAILRKTGAANRTELAARSPLRG